LSRLSRITNSFEDTSHRRKSKKYIASKRKSLPVSSLPKSPIIYLNYLVDSACNFSCALYFCTSKINSFRVCLLNSPDYREARVIAQKGVATGNKPP